MRFIPVPSVGRYFRGAFHLHELCPLSPPLPDRLAVARTLRARWQKPALSARHGFVGTRCYIIWTATAGQGARPFSFPTLACAWVSQSCSRCAPGPGQLLLQQRRGGRRTLHVHESGLGAVGCWRQYQHPHVGARCPHIWTRRVSPNRLPAEHKLCLHSCSSAGCVPPLLTAVAVHIGHEPRERQPATLGRGAGRGVGAVVHGGGELAGARPRGVGGNHRARSNTTKGLPLLPVKILCCHVSTCSKPHVDTWQRGSRGFHVSTCPRV